MELATEDLYLGAYVLSRGGALKGVRVSRASGRRTAVFALRGPRVSEEAEAYYAGRAVVNLREYREHLEALKDELFGALRRDRKSVV